MTTLSRALVFASAVGSSAIGLAWHCHGLYAFTSDAARRVEAVSTGDVLTDSSAAADSARRAEALLAVASLARPSRQLGPLDSLFGLSGKLRARLVAASRVRSFVFLRRLLGDTVSPQATDVYTTVAVGKPFAFITLVPFSTKAGTRIGTYRVGFWPAERRRPRSAAYENPAGFIRVTRENQDLLVSEHFRLRDFLTHDQPNVWPKYLVLREELIDKLELIADDLRAHGVPVAHMSVMSGFRTPQYNARGVGAGGRARDSRHQFGDAADVFVDNDQDGRMDDLNGDGVVDARDAQVIVAAAERVERAHPSLVGGAGIYRAAGGHGPFAHIDVRGYRARWGHI